MNLSRILNPDTSNNHHCRYNYYNNVTARARVFTQPMLLELVISFVEPSDISTLHSICMVNRLWCLTAIPYLWSSPFSLNININNLSDIISVYVSCLDESSQRSLLKLGIENEYIGSSYTELHTQNMESPPIDSRTDRLIRILRLPPESSPIFDYPRFMRSLDVCSLCKVICEWLHTTVVIMNLPGNSIDGNSENEINTIEIDRTDIQLELERSTEVTEDYHYYFIRELLKLFMTRATYLTHLKIDCFAECNFSSMVLFYPCFLQPSPSYISTLSHITTLDLDTFIILPHLFLEFSTHCTKISSLYIRSRYFLKPSYDLSQLIERQQSLRHLHLERITVTPKLIASIRFHATNLESLTLKNVPIADSRVLWNFPSCSRLRTLVIHYYPRTYSGLGPLWSLHFPEISKFKLIGKTSEVTEKSMIDNTRSFLELNGKSLRILDLDLNQNVYSKILPTVGERCTQLRKLTVRNYRQYDKSLGRMLENTTMELERLKVIEEGRSISGRLLSKCEFPPFKELRGARWLRCLDLHMILDVSFVERLLNDWEVPIVRFSYLYKHECEIDSHREVLENFAKRLDERLKWRRERRLVDSFVVNDYHFELTDWIKIKFLKVEMRINYVND